MPLLDREVDVGYTGATLAIVLEDIGKKTGLKHVYRRLAGRTCRFTMKADGVTARDVLRRLAGDCRLRIECRGEIVLALRPADEALRRELDEVRIRCHFVETGFDEALHYIRSFVDADFVIEVRDGVVVYDGITLQVFNMSAELTLAWILKLIDMEQGVHDGVVYIAEAGRLEKFIASGGAGGLRYMASARIDGPLSGIGRRRLEARLTDADPLKRLRAVHSLAWTERGDALRLALRAASDADARVRRQAVALLGSFGGASVSTPLRDAIYDADKEVRETAVAALGRIGGVEATATLAEAMADPELATYAVSSLGHTGLPEAETLVREAFERGDARLRGAAARALSGFGERSLPLLQRALSDTDADVRFQAGMALALIGTSAAMDSLERAVDRGNVNAMRGAAHRPGVRLRGVRDMLFQLRALREEEDAEWLHGPVCYCLRLRGDIVRDALLVRAMMLRSGGDTLHEILSGLTEGYPDDPEVQAVIESLAPFE